MTDYNNNFHGRPLIMGEIRTHWVGVELFTVQHTGHGLYTQVTVQSPGLTTRVICTLPDSEMAVRDYAQAIEDAELRRDESIVGAYRPKGEAESLPDDEDLLPLPRTALHHLREALRRYVPGGGEQLLDRYLDAAREEELRQPPVALGVDPLLANRLLQRLEFGCEGAERFLVLDQPHSAAHILAGMASDLINALTPYAEHMPKTVIILRNGNSLQVPTSVNSAGDIAGLMNAGTPSVYVGTDVNDGYVHHIRVSEIIDVYETP